MTRLEAHYLVRDGAGVHPVHPLGVYAEATWDHTRAFGADSGLVETKKSYLSVAPRFGVNVPITSWLSFYPRLAAGIEYTHDDIKGLDGPSAAVTMSPAGSPSETRTGPWLGFFAPLLVQPRPHFFVGVGPYFYHALARTTGTGASVGERTSISVQAVVGGYWGGAGRHESSGPIARMGDGYGVVISGESAMSARWTGYQGVDSSTEQYAFGPALDVFVWKRVTVGAAALVRYSTSSGIDSVTHARVTAERAGAGVWPRVGLDVPLTAWLSFFPRAGIGLSYESYSLRSNGFVNAAQQSSFDVRIWAPLLVHPASHYFIGLGPWFSRDISHRVEDGRPENPQTTVGATTTVGGWL